MKMKMNILFTVMTTATCKYVKFPCLYDTTQLIGGLDRLGVLTNIVTAQLYQVWLFYDTVQLLCRLDKLGVLTYIGAW